MSSNLCFEVRDYFSLKFYSIVGGHAAGVLLSIYRPGPGLSAVSNASCRAAGDTYANDTVVFGNLYFENAEKFIYLGVTVTNTKDIREEIKRRINM